MSFPACFLRGLGFAMHRVFRFTLQGFWVCRQRFFRVSEFPSTFLARAWVCYASRFPMHRVFRFRGVSKHILAKFLGLGMVANGFFGVNEFSSTFFCKGLGLLCVGISGLTDFPKTFLQGLWVCG